MHPPQTLPTDASQPTTTTTHKRRGRAAKVDSRMCCYGQCSDATSLVDVEIPLGEPLDDGPMILEHLELQIEIEPLFGTGLSIRARQL